MFKQYSFLSFQDGFVKFYENGPDRHSDGWPNLRSIWGYAAGALGVLTIGAIMAQRS
jgi:BCL2-like 1 (apoptosis regulator Bcl-X)